MIGGEWLLKIARLLFNERFIATVVRPTIADLQSEVAGAGQGQMNRLRARWRGYVAFWTLIIVAPFASWSEDLSKTATARLAAGPAVVTLFTIVTLREWAALVFAAGAVVAFLIHGWYDRHPSDIAVPLDTPWRSPQINFSSTDIAGNVGGLIFVVGSVLIVSLGVPSIFWFLVAGSFAACFVAWGLAAWHTRGHAEDLPCGGRPPRHLL